MKKKSPNFNLGEGFTLIELVLTIAILSLLAIIAIPKFANLIIKAREAVTLGKLGSYRSAISLYYVDTEGQYPNDPVHLEMTSLVGKYIPGIPSIEIPRRHSGFESHTHMGFSPPSFGDFSNVYPPLVHPSVVAWVFDQQSGRLWINCTHTDSKGMTWSQY